MSDYNQIIIQAERMRNNFKDLVDQPNSPEAHYIMNEIEGLVGDAKSQKSGMAIENRLKNLEHHFKELDQTIMDYSHSNMLADMSEELRQEAHNL